MLSRQLPFYASYYVLIIVAVIILICIPFTQFEKIEEVKEEQVKPLKLKRKIKAYVAILITCMAYSAAANTLITYTSSFAESIGIQDASAAFMLTAYNVGCFTGALAFVWILKKIREQIVLIVNHMIALISVIVMLLVDTVYIYYIGVAIAGFFLGVLFNVIVTVAIRMDYKHISRAGALIGTLGGASDIMTPIITGVLVSSFGISITFKYVVLMLIIAILAAIVLQFNITEE